MIQKNTFNWIKTNLKITTTEDENQLNKNNERFEAKDFHSSKNLTRFTITIYCIYQKLFFVFIILKSLPLSENVVEYLCIYAF